MTARISALAGILVVSASILAHSQATPSVQGAWRVTAVTGANGTNKSPQPGLLLFTKQHYSLLSVGGTSPRKEFGPPKDPANLTDAERAARYEAWDVLTANSGTYEVKGTTLTLHPIVAKNPSVMTGGPLTREFKISGKTLIMTQKPTAGQPGGETTTTFTRVE
jgi:lipocalin-like protein